MFPTMSTILEGRQTKHQVTKKKTNENTICSHPLLGRLNSGTINKSKETAAARGMQINGPIHKIIAMLTIMEGYLPIR